MSKTREQIVELITANKESLKFTRARLALAIKAKDKTRTRRLEASERYTKIELDRLAKVVAEMDSATPHYPDEEKAQGE